MKPLTISASSHPSAPRSFFRLPLLASCLLALLALLAAPGLHAANVTWSSAGTSTPGGDGNWTGGSTWWDGSSAVSWTASDNATFSAAGNTTVNSAVTVGNITFTSSSANISILGGAGDITLNSGITATNTANTTARTFTISESVALGANQTWTVNNGGTTGTANLAVSGIISGSNLGITKAGNGTLTLSGNNTYNGTTTVNAGILTLANSAENNKTVVGNITVSGGTLSWLNANQIADTASVTMTSGVLDLAKNETIDSLNVTGGTIGFGVNFNTINASNFSFTGGQMRTGGRQGDITLNGPITLGNFTFVWAANTATQKGIVIGGDISVNAGATVNFQGDGGSWSGINGRITLNANRVIDVGAGANMNVQWGIVGTGGITKNGTGTLTLSGTNAYNGTTTINDGILALGNATHTLPTNAVTINGGTLSIGANSDTVGAVTLAGGNITGTTGVLTGSSYALQSGSVSAILGGTSVAATKTTAGTVTLSGVNTYTGATTINAGTLSIASITNGGVAGALGNSTNAAGNLVLGGGALLYTGSNASTDRNFTLTASTSSEINVSNAATTLTMSGTSASTNGSLTKSGSGTLILSGNNGHTGGTTINGGTLMLSGTSPGSATVNSGGIIAVGTSANSVGSLTVTGLTLNSGGTYTWDMSNATGAAGTGWDRIVSSGLLTIGATSGSPFTIAIASSGAPANWDYTNSGQTWDIITYGSLSGFSADKFAFDDSAFAGALTTDSHWALSDTGSALRLTYTYSASTPTWSGASGNWTSGFTPPINSGANAIFAGAGGTATNNIPSGNLSSVGQLLFSGTGAYTLEADSGSAGYDAASALEVNSGITNSSTGTQTINLALSFASNQTISATSGDIVIGGPISGAGGLTKEGSNKLTLSGNNTYSGGTTINAGTLEIGASGRLNSGSYSNTITNNGTLIYSGTNAQTLSGAISGTGALTKNAASTLTLSGSNSYSGATTINAGALRATHANALGTTAAGTTVASGAALELSGGISIGAEALTLSGTGISEGGALRNISGDNTYAGLITLGAATRINSDSGNLTISNAGTITGNGLGLTIGGSGNTSITSIIGTGAGTLTKDGTGRLTLSGANTYTGATTINDGILATSGANMLSDSTNITVNSGGTLSLGGADTVGTLSGAGAISIGANTLTTNSSSSATFSGNITGTTGGFTKAGSGTQTLSGSANSWNGTTTVSAGTLTLSGTLSTTGSVAINGASGPVLNITGNLTKSGGNVRGFQIAATAGTAATVNVSGSGILTLGAGMFLGENGGGNGTMNVAGGTVTTNGQVWFAGANSTLNVSGGTFNAGTNTINIGGGSGTTISTLSVSGSGTFSGGGITFGIGSAGASTIVNLGDGTAGGNLSITGMSYSNGPSHTINFNGATLNVRSTSSMITTNTTTVVKSGGAVIDVNAGQTFTIGTNLTTDGTGGGLTKNGTGTLVLSGAGNNYTGTTTVNAGTLTLGANQNLGAIAGAGALNLASYTLTTNSTSDTTFSGIISGAGGSLTKNGTSTLTLTNASNSYTGATTINAGTLSIGGAGQLGSGNYSGNIINNGVLAYNSSANQTLGGTISGTGDLIKNGSSTLTLSHANTYNGSTTVNAGTLSVTAANALGATTEVTIDGGSLLVAASNAINDAADITMGNNGTLVLSGSVGEVVGQFSLTTNTTAIIDMGYTASWISFWKFTSELSDDTKLWIYNYTVGSDHVYIRDDTNQNVVNSLPNITFYSDFGQTSLGSGFFSAPELHPHIVPEPSTYATAALLLIGLGIHAYRRRQAKWNENLENKKSAGNCGLAATMPLGKGS